MENGSHNNLLKQFRRWRHRHNRNAYSTRDRYDSTMSVFTRFLAEEFHVQKLANIKPKHFVKFVEWRIEKGIAASTITTDLSSIRGFIDQYEELRESPESFPTNDELRKEIELAPRKFGGVVRAWSSDEFHMMCTLTERLKNPRPILAQALACAYWLGLRLHEVMQLDHNRLKQALENGFVAIKGKGNRWRDVPLCDEARALFAQILKRTPRGTRAFIEGNRPVHKQMKSIQKFLLNHREQIDSQRATKKIEQDCLDELGEGLLMMGQLTFHGLRHSYAMRQYLACRRQGMTPLDARLHVSNLLGHERDDVTRIYLPGLKEKRNKK